MLAGIAGLLALLTSLAAVNGGSLGYLAERGSIVLK
jgi:hypothetical protein